MAETSETKAKAAHEIVKSMGGYWSGSPWKPDFVELKNPPKK